MFNDEIISDDVLSAMGISDEVLEAVTNIVGRRPTVDELSTLLAMWNANGRQQSLLGWLRGQRHSETHKDYLYSGDLAYKDIREPRVKECLSIAHSMTYGNPATAATVVQHGDLLYMAGRVSQEFLGSDYARRCLHIAEQPIEMADAEQQREYIQMILDALHDNSLVQSILSIKQGGLFGALTRFCGNASPRACGFDILTCREVRLDAFLFGEEQGRFIISLSESQDDLFLQKLDEAGVNCCFLGRATKGRVLIDGMDFGDITEFLQSNNR